MELIHPVLQGADHAQWQNTLDFIQNGMNALTIHPPAQHESPHCVLDQSLLQNPFQLSSQQIMYPPLEVDNPEENMRRLCNYHILRGEIDLACNYNGQLIALQVERYQKEQIALQYLPMLLAVWQNSDYSNNQNKDEDGRKTGGSMKSTKSKRRSPRNPMSSPKRIKRNTFTPQQVEILEETFVKMEYVSAVQRIDLAKRAQLTEQQVKTWFQNRRTKKRKINTSLRQYSPNGMALQEMEQYYQNANEHDVLQQKQISPLPLCYPAEVASPMNSLLHDSVFPSPIMLPYFQQGPALAINPSHYSTRENALMQANQQDLYNPIHNLSYHLSPYVPNGAALNVAIDLTMPSSK